MEARRLTDRGDEVTGMHRDPSHAETDRAAGAAPLADAVAELVTPTTSRRAS